MQGPRHGLGVQQTLPFQEFFEAPPSWQVCPTPPPPSSVSPPIPLPFHYSLRRGATHQPAHPDCEDCKLEDSCRAAVEVSDDSAAARPIALGSGTNVRGVFIHFISVVFHAFTQESTLSTVGWVWIFKTLGRVARQPGMPGEQIPFDTSTVCSLWSGTKNSASRRESSL